VSSTTWHCRSTDTRRHRSELGKSKIENLRIGALRNKNVCWFDVPLNDPFGVDRVVPVRHSDAQNKYGFHFHRPTIDAVFQRHTVQIFHRDEGWGAKSRLNEQPSGTRGEYAQPNPQNFIEWLELALEIEMACVWWVDVNAPV
jgi:hypothetical protein